MRRFTTDGRVLAVGLAGLLLAGAAGPTATAGSTERATGTLYIDKYDRDVQRIVDPELERCYQITARYHSMSTVDNQTDAPAIIYVKGDCTGEHHREMAPRTAHQGMTGASVRFHRAG